MTLTPRKDNWIAFAWGLLNGTVFFIAPEAWVTYVTLRRGLSAGAVAAAMAVLGMGLAAVIMFYYGAAHLDEAKAFVQAQPLVTEDDMLWGFEDMRTQGEAGVFNGFWSGTPDKAYAVQADDRGMILFFFLFILLAAHALRMVLVVMATWGIGHKALLPKLGERNASLALAGLWVVLYGLFFAGVL